MTRRGGFLGLLNKVVSRVTTLYAGNPKSYNRKEWNAKFE